MLANNQIQKLYARSNYAPYRVSSFRRYLSSFCSLSRSSFINWIALLLTLIIILRLIFLNTFSNNFLMEQMNSRVLRNVEITAMRGTISDRNGNPLAVSSPVASIWADPSALDQLTAKQIKDLAKILGMKISELNNKLNEKHRTFVYIKRAVSPQQAALIKKLAIPGIYSIQEFKRFYPNGEVTAHVVGFNNVDDKGAEGIEYANNNILLGHNGLQHIIRDRQGDVVEDVGATKEAQDGQNVQLSIDNRIQYIAYSALKTQVTNFKAKGGSSIVLDAKTGEVLAMVNFPTYNPNNRVGISLDKLRNRAAIDIYEPGSTIKPLIVAKAIDDGKVTANTIFSTKPYKIGPKLIRDVHDSDFLSVSQIIQKSSDVGVSKIAMMYKPKDLWTYDTNIGFGQKVGTNFPGEAKGILFPYKKWYPLDQATMSFGYAISVSLLQMARAYTLFTNDGCLLPINFYKNNIPDNSTNEKCVQIISSRTASIMRNILMEATDSDVGGTGIKAQVDGYTIAGKTGTAHKAKRNGYYADKYVGSFVGFAPAKNPKIIVAVMLDEPHGNYFGGVVAAPVFSQIVASTLPLLGVKPDKVSK